MRHAQDATPVLNAAQFGTHTSFDAPINTPPPSMFYDANITWLGAFNGSPNYMLCVTCHNPHGTSTVNVGAPNPDNRMVIFAWKPAALCAQCHY
jgi:hypothetical protein